MVGHPRDETDILDGQRVYVLSVCFLCCVFKVEELDSNLEIILSKFSPWVSPKDYFQFDIHQEDSHDATTVVLIPMISLNEKMQRK